MKYIKICIGSACHIKGSEEVIESFKSLISEYKLENEIELLASFCLGKCTESVSVMRWDGEILSVGEENARYILENNIIPFL